MVDRKIRMSGWNAPAKLVDRLDSYKEAAGDTYAGIYEEALKMFLDSKEKKK